MKAITIRKLNPEVRQRIQILARVNGRSLEGQIRSMLTFAVAADLNDAERMTTQKRVEQQQKENVQAMFREVNRAAERRAQQAAAAAAAQK